ncbi:hypothetical protein JYU34_018434 [Plutella xylostella]|uniref:Carboxylesterase type B domain-containing protein n=1 Tax=Plutella xylostella TaxID=51655 RepID=A0ABQ7PXK0_PLUXY|nr:hypothetical protein JYU34_018434 [Plutella xylostella]
MILAVCVLVSCAELAGAARGAGVRRRSRDVSTTQGLVRGYWHPEPPHYQFLGIPYAAPPTGEDRFKAPQAPPSWDGIFEATHRVACPQDVSPDQSRDRSTPRVDENCLVLNIFAPDVEGTLPVVVHLHDGGFSSGWGSLEAPARLLRQGVVVVTLNYRLGALGFLCVGAAGAGAGAGNAGLKDQVAALYWLQRNILLFRGDPDDVTLHGTGAGAAAAQLLLLAPATAALYHKAILESGTALSPLSLAYNPVATAVEVAASLGFEGGKSMAELMEFYQAIPYRELLNYSKSFRPCIEDSLYLYSLIENDPREALLSSPIVDVPVLFLHTNQEVLSLVHEVPQEWFEKPDPYVNELLPGNLEIENEDTLYKVLETAIEIYFTKKPDSRYVQQYVNLYSDTYIVYPLVKSALLHAARSSHLVYLMQFSYEGNLSNHKMPLIWQPVQVSMDIDGSKVIAATQSLVVDANMKLALQTPYAKLEFWEKIYRVFYKKHISLADDAGKT